jgi:hypothetical protein
MSDKRLLTAGEAATLANQRLEKLWAIIESEAGDSPAEWTRLTLDIRDAIATGKSEFAVAPPACMPPHNYVGHLQRLARRFPIIAFVPADPDYFALGVKMETSACVTAIADAKATISRATGYLKALDVPVPASQPQNGCVLIGTPALCGYSVDAEVPAHVIRQLQLVNGVRPLSQSPGVWTVPIDQLILGLVREASAKGVIAPDEQTDYVARALDEFHYETELLDIRKYVEHLSLVVRAQDAIEPKLAGFLHDVIDAARGSQGAATPAATGDEAPRFVRKEGKTLHIRFHAEDSHVPYSVNFVPLARLLNEPGRAMGALELLGLGVDIEREEKAKQAGSEPHGGRQLDAPIPDMDEQTIRAVMTRIKGLQEEIRAISDEPDIGRGEMIEERITELLDCVDFLDTGTRDRAEKETKRPRATGEPDDTLHETIKGIETRMREVTKQIRGARWNREDEQFLMLTRELVKLHDSWIEERHKGEEMERRRPRRRGKWGSDDEAFKTVGTRLDRAKAAVADTKTMPRLAEHLEKTIVRVPDQPKWKYAGGFYWKVEGV